MADHDSNAPNAAARSWFTSGCDLPWSAEIGALLMRIYFGFVICWSAGVSKFPLDAWFTMQVAELGFPAPTLFAWLAAMSEVAGGVLLLLGLGTRFAGFFLAFTLGTAAFGYHKVDPWSLYSGQHITLLYFWGYVYFMLAGAGRLSLDWLLRRNTPVALGLAATIVATLAIACGMRTAEESSEETAADIASVESVSLAGSFNDWALTDPMTEASPGVWVATVAVEQPTPIEFKFAGNASWELAAGETDQPDARFPVAGVAETGAGAGNIEAYLPAAGDYVFRFELPSLAYSIEPAAEPESNADSAETIEANENALE